jgi:hypothetical protein
MHKRRVSRIQTSEPGSEQVQAALQNLHVKLHQVKIKLQVDQSLRIQIWMDREHIDQTLRDSFPAFAL